jgi:hypothetical protein
LVGTKLQSLGKIFQIFFLENFFDFPSAIRQKPTSSVYRQSAMGIYIPIADCRKVIIAKISFQRHLIFKRKSTYWKLNIKPIFHFL